MEEDVPIIEDEEKVLPENTDVPTEEDEVPVLEDGPLVGDADNPTVDDGFIAEPVAEIPPVAPPVAEKPQPEGVPDIETLEVFQHRGVDFSVSADGDALEDARFDDPSSEEASALWDWLRSEYGDQAQAYYNHYYGIYQQAQAGYENKRAGDYLTLANAGFKTLEPAQEQTRVALLAELGGDKPTAEKVFAAYEPKAAQLIETNRRALATWFETERGASPRVAKAKADASLFAIPDLWDRAVTQAISEDRAGFIKLVKSATPVVQPPAIGSADTRRDAATPPAKAVAARPPVPPMGAGSGGGATKPEIYLLPDEKKTATLLGIKDLKGYAAKCRANDRARNR